MISMGIVNFYTFFTQFTSFLNWNRFTNAAMVNYRSAKLWALLHHRLFVIVFIFVEEELFKWKLIDFLWHIWFSARDRNSACHFGLFEALQLLNFKILF